MKFLIQSSIFFLSLTLQAASVDQVLDRSARKLDQPDRRISSKTANKSLRERSEAARLEESSESPTDIEGVDPPKVDLSGDESSAPKRHFRQNAEPREAERGTFGVGFVAGSTYGVFGTQFDLAIDDKIEAGLGFGTGFSYTTWGIHGRYFFVDKKISPFFQGGYANWRVRRVSGRGENPRPSYLSDRFFEDKNGNITQSITRHLLYPGMGVLFMDQSGLGLSLLIQYLISLNNFNGALYGGVGLHLYF